MLVIRYDNGNTQELHIPGDKPNHLPEDVVMVQADGDELEHIKNVCVNFPYAFAKRVVKWYGDDAKFIVANIF